MAKIDYDILNKKLETFIYSDIPVFEQDIMFEERFSNIILFNKIPIQFENQRQDELYKTRTKMSFQKTVELCLEVLNSVDKKYALKLEQLIN